MKDRELIGEFADYLRCQKHLSEQTIRCYGTDLTQFCEYLTLRDEEQTAIEELAVWYNENVVTSLGTATLAARKQLLAYVDTETIKEFLLHLGEKGYSRTAIVRKLAALKSFYKMLYKREFIKSDPALSLRAEKVEKKLRRFLDHEQIVRLFEMPCTENWVGARDRAIFEILYCTGIRIGELVELSLDSVDFISEVVHIGIRGRKKRVVPLEPSAVKALKRYFVMRQKAAEINNFNTDKLFINKDGGSLNTRSIRRKLSKYVKQAGMDELISPNILRHSFVVKMLKQGMDTGHIKETLGYQVLSKAQTCNYVSLTGNRLTDRLDFSAE